MTLQRTRPASARDAGRPGPVRRDGAWTWYILIGPPFALLFLLTAAPLAVSLYTSLLKWNLGNPVGPSFIGLQNFIDLATDSSFWHSLGLTGYQVVVTVVIQLVLGTLIALLLNQDFRGSNLLRSVYLIPMMTTPVVVGLMWRLLYNTDSGMVNYLISLVGIGKVDWLGNSATAMPAVIGADVWLSTPFVVVLILAGLRSVPSEVYEAAQMDGANSWKAFWGVTLPLLKPMILLTILFRVMDAIRRFDTIYIMTGGGPGNSTETLDLHAYFYAFTYLDIGKGSAMATVLLAIIFGSSFFVLRRLQRAE